MPVDAERPPHLPSQAVAVLVPQEVGMSICHGYVATIIDTQTGESVQYDCSKLDWYDGDDGSSEFWWTEGNFSCDCNRGLSFYRAKHKAEPDDELGCGAGRYRVPFVTLSDGRVVNVDRPVAP